MAIRIDEIKGLWLKTDVKGRELIIYICLMPSPFHSDELAVISRIKSHEIRKIVIKLASDNLLYIDKNKKISPNFDSKELLNFLMDHVPRKTINDIISKLIDFFEHKMPEGVDKNLYLAWLYLYSDLTIDSIKYLIGAAGILSKSTDKENAFLFYDRVMQHFSSNIPAKQTVDYYLESVVGGLQTSRMMYSAEQRIPVLLKAWKYARKFNRWEYLSKISLRLSRALASAGHTKKAIEYINNTLKILEDAGFPSAKILPALCMGQILFWKGRIKEALDSYEKTVSGLEELGDDNSTLMGDGYMGRIYVINGRIARGMGMIEAVYKKAVLLNLPETMVFSSLLYAHSCLEVGNIQEAEKWINRAYELSENLDLLMKLMADTCNAYILYEKGDYDGAFECHKRLADYPRDTGYPHIKSNWFFEYLHGLESRGYYYEKMNFSDEINNAINSDNLFYKGIAYRQRALKETDSKTDIIAELEKSEKWLELAGAEIELAKTRIMLGDEFMKKGNTAKRKEYMEKAWGLFTRVDYSYLPKELMAIMPRERKIEVMIDKIIGINESLATMHNMSFFLDRVLDAAIDFSMATQCAFIILGSVNDIKVIACRNLDPGFIETKEFYSIFKLLDRNLKANEEIFVPDVEKYDPFISRALRIAGINSIIFLPVRMPDNKQGYICLINRLGGQPFPDSQLHYLRLLCNQISVGASNIRMFNEMRELKTRFKDEALFYKQEMGISNPIEMIVGASKAVNILKSQIMQVASTDSTVLIMGETGVGKELVAKAIHNLSERKNGSFVSVNLAALPAELIISELFGHEKGAFTGANERKKGRFEISHEGTIFLDEIGDLPLEIQIKLLRVLQRGAFERLGSSNTIYSDFRVISATNKNLYEEVRKEKFRQDLYYRLVVFPIHVPPLRERNEDIPMLVRHFIDKFGKKMGKHIKFIPKDEMEKLIAYDWPGNVRELEHFIERCVILSDGKRISFSGLEPDYANPVITGNYMLKASLADVDRDYIVRVLESTYWKVSGPKGAAKILGLKPTTLLFRMKKLGIEKPR